MARAPAVIKQKSTALQTTAFSDELEDLKSRLATPSGDKIKISNKQFKLPSGDILDFLDVVIVDFVHYNTYYAGAYDPNNIVPPNCFALSVETKGQVPSPNAPEAQAEACQGCWANEFGSSGKGKACQNRVLMAVLPADATNDTPFAILDISPTAVKGFSTYVSNVARTIQRPPYGVITHVECNPATKHDVAIFSDPQPIDMDDEDNVAFIAMVRSRRQEARDRLMTEPDVSAFTAANAPAKKGGALKAPAARRRA
jgi:hypothetical protein